jgi:hypothetical protein
VGRLPAQPAGRLDFCDPTPFADAGITGPGFVGARIEGALFAANLKPIANNPRASMPPPPAAELSDYERDVLLNWGADSNRDKCNKQGRNRAPDLRIIGEPVWDDDVLKLTIEVWDPDQDQVLGKVTVGAVTGYIPATGRREITVTGANQNDPIKVLLHDGYVSRTIDL